MAESYWNEWKLKLRVRCALASSVVTSRETEGDALGSV